MKKLQRCTISRRQFGKWCISGSAYTILTLSACRNLVNKSEEKNSYVLLSAEKRTLGMVQDHLFPSTLTSPGAKDVNALAFFSWVYADISLRHEKRKFLRSGIKWTDDKSKELYNKSFESLSLLDREKVLRELENYDRGSRWLSTILTYIFEALLSDPVYGGNTNEAGWKWLQHRAGYPRPPAGKTYQIK